METTNISEENISDFVVKSETTTNAFTLEPSKLFTLEILNMVKCAQQQHGLRHGDYQRYRGYCTRRIRRIRKALKLPQAEKRNFKRRDVTLTHLTGKRCDERYIHIPLVCAERTWAYAMQLKQESNTEPRKRFHLITKLKKACFYAHQLQELCNSDVFDARSKLECEAYLAWLQGTLYFERQQWKNAGEFFKKARVVYENLTRALPEEQREVYWAKLSEFTPNLRYCAYNIGGCGGMDNLLEMRAHGVLENLDELVNQAKNESNEGLQTIEWRKRKFNARPEKVRLFLLSAQELDKSLEKTTKLETKIELLENVLMDCKDAIQVLKEEIKQDQKSRPLSAGQMSTGVQCLLAYLMYIRHSRTLERNLYLVEQAKSNFEDSNQTSQLIGDGKRVRSQDLARLYEIILQNVQEMQQVPGMENDTEHQAEVSTLTLAFKAFRCYYIALTLADMKKWKEAVALYERSSNYAAGALEKEMPSQFPIKGQLEVLLSKIDGSKFCAHAYSVLEDGANIEDSSSAQKMQKSSKPLHERLSQYKEDLILLTKTPNVYKITPDMEAISCRPLFFDLAMNYVEMPTLDEQLKSDQSTEAATLTGLVKGFLGWGFNKK